MIILTQEDTRRRDLRRASAPDIQPLLKEHYGVVYDSMIEAFKDDPIYEYVRAGQRRPGPWKYALNKYIFCMVSRHEFKYKLGYTVNAGGAVVICSLAEEDLPKKSPLETFIDKIYEKIKALPRLLNTREQIKRQNELESKVKQLPEEVLGERAKEMMYLDALFVKPELQNLGYGSALLNKILTTADEKGQSVWLFSSKELNQSYYERFGFKTIASVKLGDDNPEWLGEPIILPLMVREPYTEEKLLDDFTLPPFILDHT